MPTLNPLLLLAERGQSVWLDYISRELVIGSELTRLIAEDNVTGLTSNPTIFEKAIAGSSDYDRAIGELALAQPEAGTKELYEALAIDDIRAAADRLRPVYDRTHGTDGFVSLEVSPLLAHDSAGTAAEGRRLWAAVGRPNLLIKVPATPEGIPAIETRRENLLSLRPRHGQGYPAVRPDGVFAQPRASSTGAV